MKAPTAIFLLAVAAGCYVEGKYDYMMDHAIVMHAGGLNFRHMTSITYAFTGRNTAY